MEKKTETKAKLEIFEFLIVKTKDIAEIVPSMEIQDIQLLRYFCMQNSYLR